MEPSDWVEATGGRLTRGEWLLALLSVPRGQRSLMSSWVALLLDRRPARPLVPAEFPDTPWVRAARELAALPDWLVGHSERSFIYARALADLDERTLDDEVLAVSAVLHDVGLLSPKVGMDFTRRGSVLALEAAKRSRTTSSRARAAANAIADHITFFSRRPTVTNQREAFYLQAGSLLDLTGTRSYEVPVTFARHVVTTPPPRTRELRQMWRREAWHQPSGRPMVAWIGGFGLAMTCWQARLLQRRFSGGDPR